MSLATDILKEAALRRCHQKLRRERVTQLTANWQNGAKLSAPAGSRTGRLLISVSSKHKNAPLSLIGYLITGNRRDTMIFRRNHRDDNTSGGINKPLLR